MARMGRLLIFSVAILGLISVLVASGIFAALYPKLPSTEYLKDFSWQMPLRIYTHDHQLIGEFGTKRRIHIKLEDTPELMKQAVLAAEDERFYRHLGIDWQGLARAVWHLIRTGEKGPGGSTITMQVARNFFLGREKTYARKLNEILLAFKIEQQLSKEEILELYLNKIFLGHRAYGVGAAARTYYGKDLPALTLPQIAMIAGLPKAPSRFNPIVDPERAIARRNYVLGRMHELAYINDQEYQEASTAPVTAKLYGYAIEVEAPYVAEMVRRDMESQFGDKAYTTGYKILTTVDSRLQAAANRALHQALLAYDERHGYRGPRQHLEFVDDPGRIRQFLANTSTVGYLVPAVITAVHGKSVKARTHAHDEVDIPWAGLQWARPYIDENRRGPKPESAADVLGRGDVIRIRLTEAGWRLAQVPKVQGTLVAMDPQTGGILALVGGFDFALSKFNRAMHARRQPGSSFKPFIYSAALDKGFTAASIINDAPLVFNESGLEAAWRPENYSGRFFGPTRLREALVYSRNLVSIRLLQAIGIGYTHDYLSRFGFDKARLPRNLSLALGSGSVTPLQLTTGYCVFANGGFKIEPYYTERVLGPQGQVLIKTPHTKVCKFCDQQQAGAPKHIALSETTTQHAFTVDPEQATVSDSGPVRPAPRVLTPQTTWLINSMLHDVIQRGTGRRARVLGRTDLAGKTGTTNEHRDAWFAGYSPRLVVSVWVGFDHLHSLGERETGSKAALPLWIDFMGQALKDTPETHMEQPDGMMTVRIDPETGDLARAAQPTAIFETFRLSHVPKRLAEPAVPSVTGKTNNAERVTKRLF
jgi:penicillin-binding protein 1A